MSYPVHNITSPDGFQGQDSDRVHLGVKLAVANASGANGAMVTTAVTGSFPANYTVIVNPGQSCGWSVTAKTPNGFNVNLFPFSGTTAVAAGSFDCVLVG